jgi:hypothetical protein
MLLINDTKQEASMSSERSYNHLGISSSSSLNLFQEDSSWPNYTSLEND